MTREFEGNLGNLRVFLKQNNNKNQAPGEVVRHLGSGNMIAIVSPLLGPSISLSSLGYKLHLWIF